MNRRQFLTSGVILTAGIGVGLWQLPRVKAFTGLRDLRDYLQELPANQLVSDGAFSAAQSFIHCAQSIDYSIEGYPSHKPQWFQQSAGKLAFNLFELRDGSRHNLAEPIPGAPDLPSDMQPSAALGQLLISIERFETFTGEHPAHFAYGPLNHAQYAKAHAMHIIEHLSVMRLS